MPLTDELRRDYERLYTTQVTKEGRDAEIKVTIKQILAGKDRYLTVSEKTHVPWYVIGIIHSMEGSSNFSTHLHNGDSLKHRTVNVPAGRPVKGNPPFQWETSAIDSLQFQGFDVWTNWSIAGTLYKLELYNGFGYRNHGIVSPYLWGGTTFYEKGKYVVDGKWDANAVSAQIGAAPILKKMNKDGLI